MDQTRPYPTQDSEPRRTRLLRIAGILIFLAAAGIGVWFAWKALVSRPKEARPDASRGGRQTVIVQSEAPTTDPYPGDKDRDGLKDSDEVAAGTSDVEFDSDFDGLSDADEIRVWQTDPTKADTDGDGYADGFETGKGFNPRGSGKLEKNL